MRYDIVPMKQKYRGMGRSLTVTDLWNKKTQKVYDILLEKYFRYLDLYELADKRSFEEMILFCQEIIEYDIDCEMIVYDAKPIEEIYGYELELLGIDIIHDMCESLISDAVNPLARYLLNDNGLCKTEIDVEKIVPLQIHGNLKWIPVYVYKVRL